LNGEDGDRQTDCCSHCQSNKYDNSVMETASATKHNHRIGLHTSSDTWACSVMH